MSATPSLSKTARSVAGAALLSGAFGSLHAFSLLLGPIESATGASRAEASLVYSSAIVCLTLAVLASHRLLARVAPAWLALLAAAAAAAGLALAAAWPTLNSLWLGYGAIFGAANGIGYSLAIDRAAIGWPARQGLSVGLITAAYAGGAVLFSELFPGLLAAGGLTLALLALAGTVVLAGLAAAGLFAGLPAAVATGDARSGPPYDRTLVLLWSGYFLGASAGLMAIGHAAGMVAETGGAARQLAAGAIVIAVGNAAGSIASGWLTDRMALRFVLATVAALSAAAMLLLAGPRSVGWTIAGLGTAGIAYGALIAVYPVAARRYYDAAAARRAFGRIFTAWGLAGLSGPWLAGAIHDAGGGYRPALLAAAVAATASALLSLMLPRPPQGRD